MNATLRRAVLGGALIGTVAAVWAVSREDSTTAVDDDAQARAARRVRPVATGPEMGSGVNGRIDPRSGEAVRGAGRAAAVDAPRPGDARAVGRSTVPTPASPGGAAEVGLDAGPAAVAGVAGPLDLARIRRALPDAPAPDAFGARSWDPPPRKPTAKELAARSAPAAPPPPPQAPPLPFGYLGMLGDGDSTTVFLSRGEASLAAKVGDTIDGLYRVDAIDDRHVQLTYLPLDARQSLPLEPKP